MLKKFAFIPSKIYRVSYGERPIFVGTYYDQKRKKINSKGATFEVRTTSKSSSVCSVDLIDNYPINNVRLVSNNGVQLNDEYDTYIDSDFITDVAFNALANKNGKLKGSYIFCSIGDKLRLVRVESPLYNQILLSVQRRNASKIRKRDFQKGGVYVTPGGNTSIYIGNIHTESPNYRGEKAFSSYPIKNRMLFLTTSKHDPQFSLDEINSYSLDVKKTHSFIEMVDKVTIPDNIINSIRDKMIKSLKEEIVAHSKKDNHNSWLHYKFIRYCPIVNMYEVNDKKLNKFDVNKYLTYA
jgi:hypothetical protein